MNDVYGPAFFGFMAGCRDNYRKLGDAICAAAEIQSRTQILDVGCGLGYVGARIKELRAFVDVQGVDAFAPETKCEIPVWNLDFESTPGFKFPRADVVICTETAEHLTEGTALALVGAICAAARKRIVWSAAPPGQDEDDPGHINLKPLAYWLNEFSLRDWLVNRERTDELQRLMLETHAQHEYCAGNFLILDRLF